MQLTTSSFRDGGVIPDRYALARPVADGPVTLSDNINPQLSWDDVPEATRSFAIICHDPDVPSSPDDVNKPDREVPADLARVEFFHWVVADLPEEVRSIAEGEFSSSVVPHGKQVPIGFHRCRQGLNDFTGWFRGDPEMEGSYYGYDGPAPPWNDSIVHRYVFTVYALDVESVTLEADFSGHDLRTAIGGHVLSDAAVSGVYTQNLRLR